MMVKKNIELNEQVLRLLKQQIPLLQIRNDQKDESLTKVSSASNPTEEWMKGEESGEDIESILLKSKMEYELSQSREEQEFQKLLEQACKESLKYCESEQREQKEHCETDLRAPPIVSQTSQPLSTSSLPELTTSETSVKSSEQVEAMCPQATASSLLTGAEAAAKWIETARQEAASLPVHTSTSTSTVSLLCPETAYMCILFTIFCIEFNNTFNPLLPTVA